MSGNEIISMHIVPVCDNGLICFIFFVLDLYFPLSLCIVVHCAIKQRQKKEAEQNVYTVQHEILS